MIVNHKLVIFILVITTLLLVGCTVDNTKIEQDKIISNYNQLKGLCDTLLIECKNTTTDFSKCKSQASGFPSPAAFNHVYASLYAEQECNRTLQECNFSFEEAKKLVLLADKEQLTQLSVITEALSSSVGEFNKELKLIKNCSSEKKYTSSK
ncbi:MAG: hypothetical protein AABX04_05495 [Nanoarchaeota archaeon]